MSLGGYRCSWVSDGTNTPDWGVPFCENVYGEKFGFSSHGTGQSLEIFEEPV